MSKDFSVEISDSVNIDESQFEDMIEEAYSRIRSFASEYGWEKYTEQSFFNKVFIYSEKADFDRKLIELTGMPDSTEFPVTFSGGIIERVLILKSPDVYAAIYPDGVEKTGDGYIKLIVHEMAHMLHVRILNGEEEKMGPIWFFEGFAIHASDQFSDRELTLAEEEMSALIIEEIRTSYIKYGALIRYLTDYADISELVLMAADGTINDWALKKVNP